jgi:hypothetical protein
MKEPYEKGIANHSAPSFAASTARCSVKRKQGYGWAGYRASKNNNWGADAVVKVEGNMERAESRALDQPRVVADPTHVQKLHAREPGDLGDVCTGTPRQTAGKRRLPHGPDARLRGVGQRNSTDESFKQ